MTWTIEIFFSDIMIKVILEYRNGLKILVRISEILTS